jgi:hypothetical protein
MKYALLIAILSLYVVGLPVWQLLRSVRQRRYDPCGSSLAETTRPVSPDILGGDPMPTVKELTVPLENQPGTLAKLCKALADRKVNILAIHGSTDETRNQVHLVVDNLSAAKIALGTNGLTYTEADVAQVALPNHPGELARVAARLGESKININYAYGGNDPNTNVPLLYFGVVEAARAAKILDQAATAAA